MKNPREFYITPAYTVESIRPHLHNYIYRSGPLCGVDAGCGFGALSPLLSHLEIETRIGLDIQFEFDLRPRGLYDVLIEQDFLTFSTKVDIVVMNPPFSLAVDFVQHARSLSPVVVALLPLPCLAPKKYEPILGDDENFDMFVLGKRPAFTYPGSTGSGAKFECAWFVWHNDLDRQIRRI